MVGVYTAMKEKPQQLYEFARLKRKIHLAIRQGATIEPEWLARAKELDAWLMAHRKGWRSNYAQNFLRKP
jgi:hypothetical protein